ncbi:S8 family serine peptidase [Novosphingobium sp. G106]|nr:S8 family serine peptidase [Novosphingobium sp. G106]
MRLPILLAIPLIAQVAFAGVAQGQGRGVPREIPMPRDMPMHGPPEWAGNASSRAAAGQEQVEAVQNQRLSRQQTDRAATIAKQAPADFELDRNGALAIRGEVLSTGLDAVRLARIERAGFSILRQNDVPDFGISLTVIEHEGMSAKRALERLRRIDPGGDYDLNHVFFQSGLRGTPQSTTPAVSGPSESGTSLVGLIDAGVAGTVESWPRIRIMRRNFAPSESIASLHGTAVASLLARKPGRVTIFAADIFGAGPRGGTTELLVRALGWMASQKVPVINVSMVGPANGLVATVTGVMIGKGFTIVAPVGNDGAAARLLFPASYPGVIAVSGADADGRLLPEASRVKRVDFVGPGIATVPDLSGRATIVRGTSFAAPVISRQIADYVRMPDPLSAQQAVSRLSQTAVHPRLERQSFGHGLVGVEASANPKR